MRRRMKWRLFQLIVLLGGIYILSKQKFFSSQLQYDDSKTEKDLYSDKNLLRKYVHDEGFDTYERKDRTSLKTECKSPSLDDEGYEDDKVLCRRTKPISDSCDIAQQIFHSEKTTTCSKRNQLNICKVVGTPRYYHIECDEMVCYEQISLGMFNTVKGQIEWTLFQNIKTLETSLSKMVNSRNSSFHHGFCILKCLFSEFSQEFFSTMEIDDPGNITDGVFFNYNEMFPEYFGKQILLLPPRFPGLSSQYRKKDFVNLNLIFVDSVSRSHFYRSMPKTVELFNSFHKNYKAENYSPLVLDFKLLQGIKSRTFESLEAVFTGFVNPLEKAFGVLEMPPHPLETEKLLRLFKSSGYRTLWLEDLCVMWEWGISKDLLVYDKKLSDAQTWQKLQAALLKAGIDDIGPTLANCEILSANGVPDHFHGPDAVCYNGYYQHEYFLQYLDFYQKEAMATNVPFISFMETNVGHEESGRRIQTFDQNFADYLQSAIQMKNTLTIIFSDHGNAYGGLLDRSLEGSVELYHPFLFMILPPKVQNILGERKVKHLISNQRRLVSLLDLHYTLRSLTSQNKSDLLNDEKFKAARKVFNVNTNGLFSSIPRNRTCRSMPRLMPNHCICEGFENAVKNYSRYAIFAFYALGELNNRIQSQYRHHYHGDRVGFGQCRRLIPTGYRNVRISFEENDSVMTKMKIHVQSNPTQKDEIFLVAIRTLPLADKMELVTFERITPYSHFKTCADKGVNLNLCVCSTNPYVSVYDVTQFSRNNVDIKNLIPPLDSKLTIERPGDANDCILIFIMENKQGASYDISNICKSVSYSVNFAFLRKNMLVSNTALKVDFEIKPGEIKSVFSAVQNNAKLKYKWKAIVKVKSMK